ncbi:MAG: MFS transporter [Actinomycetota bacterium]
MIWSDPDMEPKKERLGRNVVVLTWVSFLQDAASEMLYPVLPLFITSVLGAPPAVLGLIEGVAEGTASVWKAISGRMADRMRKRPLIFLGYSLSALAKPLIGLAAGWPLVLVARFVDRTGKGIRTSPRDALIASDTPAHLRGRAFGLHRSGDSAGAVVGPLLGLAIYEMVNHELRPLFFAAFVPALLSVAFIARVTEPEQKPRQSHPAVLGSLPLNFKKVVAFIALFGLINFSDAFLLLRASKLGLTFVQVILVYVLYNVVYAALSYPAGRVSDRLGRRTVFTLGLGIFSVCYFGLGFVTTSAWVWVLLPLYGAYTALTDGVSKAWVSDMLPQARLGTGLGAFHACFGVAVLVASLWAGVLWQESGRLPLMISGVLAAILSACLLLFGRRLDAV